MGEIEAEPCASWFYDVFDKGSSDRTVKTIFHAEVKLPICLGADL